MVSKWQSLVDLPSFLSLKMRSCQLVSPRNFFLEHAEFKLLPDPWRSADSLGTTAPSDSTNRQAVAGFSSSPSGDLSVKFPCPQCNRSYRHKCDLKRHLKFECGQQPNFLCVHCPRRFHQKTNLKRHVFTVHSALLASSANGDIDQLMELSLPSLLWVIKSTADVKILNTI